MSLQLIAEALNIHREEKSLTMRSLRVIGELELRRAAPSCGMSVEKFTRHIALTKDQYLKRSAASRTLRFIPEAKLLLEAGEISLSHLALISTKITRANRKVVLENIRGKSLREAKLFMSRVTPDGELLPEEEAETTMSRKLSRTMMPQWQPQRRDPLSLPRGSAKIPPVDIYPLPCGIRCGYEIRGSVRICILHPDGSRCQEKMMIELDRINLIVLIVHVRPCRWLSPVLVT